MAKGLCYILTFDPAPKMLFLGDTPVGSDTFQWPVIERDRVGGLRLMILDKVLFTNPSARAGYDTRSIFKRSLTGLNSEFSFS